MNPEGIDNVGQEGPKSSLRTSLLKGDLSSGSVVKLPEF